MAYALYYAHVTTAGIPRSIWDEVWFSLESWKGFLQSSPGYHGVRIMSREIDNGDVRIIVASYWDTPEELNMWLQTDISAEKLLMQFTQPAYDIQHAVYEVLS